MKRKILNCCITGLAIVGVIGIIGAVGNMDYMVAVGSDYPLSATLKTMLTSGLCIIPAVIREVM